MHTLRRGRTIFLYVCLSVGLTFGGSLPLRKRAQGRYERLEPDLLLPSFFIGRLALEVKDQRSKVRGQYLRSSSIKLTSFFYCFYDHVVPCIRILCVSRGSSSSGFSQLGAVGGRGKLFSTTKATSLSDVSFKHVCPSKQLHSGE